jgi:hypothetical protein
MRRNEHSLYSKKQSTPISLRALFYVRKRSMRTSPPASKNHHQHKLSIMARRSSRLALNVAIQTIAGDFFQKSLVFGALVASNELTKLSKNKF